MYPVLQVQAVFQLQHQVPPGLQLQFLLALHLPAVVQEVTAHLPVVVQEVTAAVPVRPLLQTLPRLVVQQAATAAMPVATMEQKGMPAVMTRGGVLLLGTSISSNCHPPRPAFSALPSLVSSPSLR